MVKLSLDTRKDDVEDLEEALELLQEAITRRKAEATIPDHPEESEEKPDEGFLTIKVESEEELVEKELEDEPPEEESSPITESELTDMFGEEAKPKKKSSPKTADDAFIEIVEFDEDQ